MYRLAKRLRKKFGPQKYQPTRLHRVDLDNLKDAASKFDGNLMRIRPYRESAGVTHAEDFIAMFHDPSVERNWYKDILNLTEDPHKYAFELWWSDGKLRFIVKTPTQSESEEIHKGLTGLYPNAKVQDSKRFMPNIPGDSYIAGGEFKLRQDKYAPVRSFSGPDPFERDNVEGEEREEQGKMDPYKKITSEIVGHEQQAVLFQVTFEPAPQDWTDGYGPFDPSAERVAEFLNEGRFIHSHFNPRIIDPTDKDERTAMHISDLEGSQAFDVNIRFFVTDKTKKGALKHAKGIENSVCTTFQNNKVAQQFDTIRYQADEVKEQLQKAAHRKVEHKDLLLTKSELAALAHLPNGTINTSNVDFVETVVGEKAPGESSITDKKDVVSEKDDELVQSEFIETTDIDDVALSEDTAETGEKTVLQKAEEIVESGGKKYYRDSVDPTEYSETRITDPMPDERKEKFLQLCADYEMRELDVDNLYTKSSDEKVDELIDMIEEHIKLAYLNRAKQATIENQSSSSQNTPSTTPTGDSSETTLATTPDATTTVSQQPTSKYQYRQVPNEEQQQNQLPTTVEGVDQEEFTEDFTSRTHKEEDKLPATQPKHPVNFVETKHAQTRTKDGELRTMNFIQEGGDGGTYMGEDTRKLFIERHAEKPDNDIWIGYQDKGNNPVREVGIPKQSWFQHISMFGTTGKGKSTQMKNMANQVARKGYGFVMIDPKGDMAQEMMEELPEDRLDDVIWIEPGSIEHDKIAAINFLEASVPKGHPRYDREVESIVSDLQAVLRAGEYWGPKMAGITKNITRAMVRSENPYTLYDMYNVLIREEKRWNFARSLRREDVDLGTSGSGDISEDVMQYSRRIAEMDDEEVDPVVRRLQDWAESPISKEIVSHRYNSVNINDAIEDGKIILLKNSVEDREIKRVISTAIMRRVWVAIQARAETAEEEERTPFFAFIDEFDDVVSEDMEIDKMLSKARSGKMSVTLATQNPSQIQENHPNILSQIFNNTDTMMSFAVRDPNDGRLIADRMGDEFDYNDLTQMARYRIVTRVSYAGEQGPKLSRPLGLKTFPDYPPLRTEEQAKEAIQESLDTYGVEPMENYPGETDLLISGGGLQEQTVVNFLEMIWTEHHREGSKVVPVENVADRFERKVGDAIEDYPKGIAVPEEMIEVHNVNFDDEAADDDPFSTNDGFDDSSTQQIATDGEGGTSTQQSNKWAFKADGRIYVQDTQCEVSITAEGIDAILQQDSGRSQPTPKHRQLIYQAFRWFARVGFDTSVPVQTGANEVCDGKAELPINSEVSVSKLQEELQKFKQQYPLASDLSDDSNINIEAEGTTQRKPARTIQNVLRAYKEGKKAALFVEDGRKDGHGRTYHANRVEGILTDPPYYRRDVDIPPGVDEDEAEEIDADDEFRLLYNKAEKLKVGNEEEDQEKFALIEKGARTVWVDHGDTVELYDGHGSDANNKGTVKHSETEYASSNSMQIWCRYDSYQKEWVVYPGGKDTYRYDSKKALKRDYQFVRAPLLVEQEVSEMPTRDDWFIAITPDPTALSRDPQSEDETIETADDFTPELDLEYPPEEVPLIYEDGETWKLIPEEHEELLTEPRQREEETEQEETIESEPADPQAHEQTMNSLEQIKLEREVKEEIQEYKSELTVEELERYDEVKDEFGAKNPAEIAFWRDVWDRYNKEYDGAITESELPNAVRQAKGMRKEESKEAVEIGQEFDLLVEDVPTNDSTIPPGIDKQNATFLRLVLPEERPDLYVDNAEQYATRNVWVSLWDEAGFFDLSDTIPEDVLSKLCKTLLGCESDIDATALIAVGEMCGALRPQENGYALSSERPDQFWIDVWEAGGGDISEPLNEKFVKTGIRIVQDGSIEEAQERFNTAVATNEIYSPPRIADDEYLINDPSSDDGPPIHSDDDPSDDGGSGNNSPSDTDGTTDTTDTTATTETTSTPDTTTDTNSPNTTDETSEPAEPTTADSTGTSDPTDATAENSFTAETDSSSVTTETNTTSESSETDTTTPPNTTGATGEDSAATKSDDTSTTTSSSNSLPQADLDASTVDQEPTESTETSDPAETSDTSETTPDEEPQSQSPEQTETTSPTTGDDAGTTSDTDLPQATQYTSDEDASEPEAETTTQSEPSTQEHTADSEAAQTDTPDHSPSEDESASVESSSSSTEEAQQPQIEPTPEDVEEQFDLLSERAKFNPPERQRVLDCFEEAIEFFHDQLDMEITPNVEYNEDNPYERLRKPETPREYYQDPRYDDNPSKRLVPAEKVPDCADNPETVSISEDALVALNDLEWCEQSSIDELIIERPAHPEDTFEIKPFVIQTRENRGWSPEIIEEKQLGFAPVNPHKLENHLKDKGYTEKELVATGLISINSVNEDDDEKPTREFISTLWQGRYVLPYLDGETERPIYAIYRSIDVDRNGWGDEDDRYQDWAGNNKYTKTKMSEEYNMLSEPIFGQETIIEGEPLVITEGMADAITAHDNGIPSISPVTTKFDAENFEVLKDIIEEYNIPRVSIAPDADPSPYTVENKYTQEYRENYNENKDRNEDGEVSTEEPVVFDGDKTDAEALEEALTYHEFGPGLRGAAQTGRKLDKAATNEITATDGANPLPKDEIDSDADESYADVPQPYRQHYIAESEPPRHEPAHTPDRSFRTRIIQVDNTLYTKYDFDDYINANYHHYCPPSNWIKNDLIEQNIQASWVKDLLEAEDIEYPTLEEHDAINSGDDDYLKPEWITRLAAEGIAVEGLKIAPPLATVRNYTQTLAPGDIPTPAEASKNSMEKAREKSQPSKINLNSGGNKLFNLSIRDVLGIREGFRGKSPFGHIGDSENYFCVIDEQIAYCHKRDATYNPITSILVLAGERKKTDPRGRMAPREKFKAWEYARKNNIVEAQIPNEGLIYYAKKRGIATADDVQTKESDSGAKYESLDNRSYYQAIEKLTEEYNFNILRDTYEEKQASNDEKAGSQESKKDNQTDRSKNTSTQQNDSTTESESEPESKKSARTTHATNTTDDANKQAENNLAEDVDGGVSLSEIDEDLAASVSDSSSESSETNGETSSEDQETNDGTTRFQTYTPPAEDDEDVDIDKHAVKQFVEEFAEVDPNAGSDLVVPKTEMMDAFSKWAKINNIELNKLSQSSAMNIRKGKLKSTLEEEYGITTGRPSINGERTRCFKCIELSDSIEELLEE